ncbi:MAG: AAA family ATPase [Myxococcales bacterium]|nr:AAA family ATPase [Myxococcales bacterium]
MHIERLRLKDVGPFDDVTIDLAKGTDRQLADVYLLTGPNGTGKSTILYALASVIAGNVAELGRDLLVDRMRTRRGMAALYADDATSLAAVLNDFTAENELSAVGPFGGPTLPLNHRTGALTHLDSGGGWSRYSESAAQFLTQPVDARPKFDWAAFAYAGVRSVSDVQITSIQEPKQSPFDDSLSFVHTADTGQLANWIASQNFRRLKAKEAGHADRAEQLARTIRDIESVVAQIVDDPDFGFVITDEDDDVRVRWKGVVVRLGLLPDGLKSIVSWIADLLMRLDRIPWQDATPVLQRSFLLLLDEVDIHLHPAWQRKVLPLVQRMFPNAQIIASTHSPFVVTSVDDAQIITLKLRGRASVVDSVTAPQIGHSYTAVLRSIFGIDSEFDIDTEARLERFHAARQRLLAGDASARLDVDRLADELARRSEELREVVGLELGQLHRQLNRRAAP